MIYFGVSKSLQKKSLKRIKILVKQSPIKLKNFGTPSIQRDHDATFVLLDSTWSRYLLCTSFGNLEIQKHDCLSRDSTFVLRD